MVCRLVFLKEKGHKIEDFIKTKFSEKEPIFILVDRLVVRPEDEDNENRISDSIQTAFYEGEGDCYIEVVSASPLKIGRASGRERV